MALHTRIEATVRVDDANDRPREGVFTVAQSLDKDLAQKQGEVRVAIARQALPQA